eukprot:15473373-Alexandrium_andersonii.AAC.1
MSGHVDLRLLRAGHAHEGQVRSAAVRHGPRASAAPLLGPFARMHGLRCAPVRSMVVSARAALVREHVAVGRRGHAAANGVPVERAARVRE